MTLIGQEEIWEKIKKANALAAAGHGSRQLSAVLMSFVEQIPISSCRAQSLEVRRYHSAALAFIKVGKVFGSFMSKFMSWAGDTIWDLLKIIFEVVARRNAYLQK